MTDDPQAMTDKGPRTAEIVHDPYGYRVRIAVPEDHAPDGTVARWTADASAPVGYPYTYSTIGVSVYVDFAGDDEDTPEKRGYRQGIAAARAAVEGLRELSDAATPGPWRTTGTEARPHWYVTSDTAQIHGNLPPTREDYHPDTIKRWVADARLIAAAVNWVRAALDRTDRP